MSINIFLVLFLILLFIYLYFFKNNKRDLYIISVSIIIILYLIYKNKNNNENFIDYYPINIEESIDKISSNLIIYLTVFNSKSIDGKTKNWNDISLMSNNKKDCIKGPKNFSFDSMPIVNKINGVYLGNNRLIGPYCNELGINFSDRFTILLTCKHGNLLSNTNNEIELIKLYGNSTNNNVMSLFIQTKTINNDNNVQTGNLLFNYIDQQILPCKIDSTHDYINLDKDVLSFYFIIKDSDNIRILYLSEKSNAINQILKINISTNDITFSNKEIVINRLLNWNASVFNFALYNTSISDDTVGSMYTHIMDEYIKNKDPTINKILPEYNNIVDYLNNTKKCKLDKLTCDNCNSITDWSTTDIVDLSNSTKKCRLAVNNYCSANINNDLCACWNSKNTIFNDPLCVSIREKFSGNYNNKLDSLSDEDLEYIKNKYNLGKCDIKKDTTNDIIDNVIDNTNLPIELDFKYTPIVLDKLNADINSNNFKLNNYLNNKTNIKNNSIDPVSKFVDTTDNNNFFNNFYASLQP